MKGNVYSRQKCPACNGAMKHDENRSGVYCVNCIHIPATRLFYVVFGREINKRFKTYDDAWRFLMELRIKTDRGTLDVRDYMASEPLGFANLTKEYLAFKRRLKLASFYHIKRNINAAANFFGNRNVKDLGKKDFRAFLDSLELAEKTKSNICSQIHDFYYNWLYEEEEIIDLTQLPKFPKIHFELRFRKLISIQDREILLEELKKRVYKTNPKLWLAVDMLASYNKFRPMDLRNVKEGDIDLDFGVITIWRPTKSKKKKNPKVIQERLLDYHIEEIKRLKKEYPAMAATPFFRHSGKTQAKKDTPFGINYVYKNWKKVCKDLGVDDLDLYGATRHSTTHAIAKAAGKAAARKFSGHDTDKAFDRYCQIADEESFEMTQLMAKMRGEAKSKPEKMVINK